MSSISVIGAGSWGTAVANLLAQNNHTVTLFHYKQSFIDEIKLNGHPNLSNYIPVDNIYLTSKLDDLYDTDFLFFAVPTKSLSSISSKVKLDEDSKIVLLCKGIDMDTHFLPSQIINQLNSINEENICVLSGPSHAEEVLLKVPTAVVAASKNMSLNRSVQQLLSNSSFRVYTNSDIVGVEVAGAAKNVISIASGICIGLGFGDNTTAALISRGINEIMRLGKYFGAEESTFYGLAGIGDLAVTAFSRHSRNRSYGEDIGKGKSPENSLKSMGMVVEGYYTASAINEIIQREKISMPISSSVYRILYEDLSPRTAIMELMNRDLTHENN